MAISTGNGGGLGLTLCAVLAFGAAPVVSGTPAAAQTAATTTVTVDAGPDQTITLPVDQVTLNGAIGGGTARWIVRAGVDGAVLSSTSSPVTTATFSRPGTFKFELQSLDARGRRIGFASAKVVVLNARPQTAWRERILNPNGTINFAQYAAVARNYHTAEMVNYRLGPSAVDYGTPAATKVVHRPDANGLWKAGRNLALADKFCQTPDKLIQSDDKNAYGDGYGGGGGWQMAGQLLFSPDATAPAELKAGVSNARAFDGAQAARASDGSIDALCMRMRAEWYNDWWNRNGISTPTTPAVYSLKERYPNLPLPAIATARGQVQSSITGFLAFQNGVIAAAGTGNDGYNGIGNAIEPQLQLPAGKVPTALALTAMNEFLFVTVWDTAARKGQLGVIAVGPDDPANIGPSSNGRHAWGVQSWPVIRGLKLLGFVDLPMVAPNTLSVALSTGTQKFRGFNTWRSPELATDEGRKDWHDRGDLDYDQFLPSETHWKLLAGAGYAVVGSRAENKVAIVDLRPLLNFYRKMYLTNQANWDATADDKQGSGDTQWPYTFTASPEQKPVVLGTLNIPQPTAVFARQKRIGSNTRSGVVVHERWNEAGKRLTIAAMDGTIRQYDVTSLVNPALTPKMPTSPIAEWKTGANPTQVTSPIAGDLLSDDIFVVSRGTRKIFVSDYKGQSLATLEDSRLVDPVFVTIGINLSGYFDSGPETATNARVITVLDYNGKTVHDYGMYLDPLWRRQYEPDYVPGPKGWHTEQWPFKGSDGKPGAPFLYGFGNRMPGKPFMFSIDEVI